MAGLSLSWLYPYPKCLFSSFSNSSSLLVSSVHDTGLSDAGDAALHALFLVCTRIFLLVFPLLFSGVGVLNLDVAVHSRCRKHDAPPTYLPLWLCGVE